MIAASTVIMIASLWMAQNGAATPACREWRECQRLALEAYGRAEYEQFHDLAWRTVQTGPPRNPELMYLLARAQSLSGRPHDALVMLERLAEMKFATAAATDDDFRPVRQLRQWPELEATLGLAPAVLPITAGPSAGARVPTVSPAPIERPAAPAVPLRRADEAVRVAQTALASVGLAYDRVSSRFVAADADRRKLVVIDERSHHVIDLVTAESARFGDIDGLEIDPARGDLWVVSAAAPACALHKLQLVSGRPLDRIPLPPDLQPCRPVDVAVTPSGGLLLLDSATPRLIRYRPASRTFLTVARLPVEAPTSVAPAGDRFVYIAHASGIVRVDSVNGSVAPLGAVRDVALAGFERIRWVRDSLVGVQRMPDGSTRAVRVTIGDGQATATEVIDNDFAAANDPISAVSGDDFYLLVQQPSDRAGDGEIVIRRSRLR